MKHFASAVNQPLAKFFLTLLLTVCAAGLYAQLGTLSVQGVLTKADGTAVDDGSYNIEFSLWKSESSTNVADRVHVETIATQTTGGVYSVILGLGTPFGGAATFAEVYYLGVKFGSTELLPRPRLTSAPYALALLGSTNIFPGTGSVIADDIRTNSYTFKTGTTSGLFWNGEMDIKHAGNSRILIGGNGTNYITGASVFNNDIGVNGRVNSSGGFGYNSTGTGLFFDGNENKASIYTTGSPRFHAWEDGKNYYRATNGHVFDVGSVAVFGNVNASAFRARGGTPGPSGFNNNGYAFEGNGGDLDSGMFSNGDGQISLYANDIQSMNVQGNRVTIYPRLYLGDVPNNVDGHNLEWNPPGKGSGDYLVSINTSTRRFKHNIVPLKEDYSQILHLEPKRYTRTTDPNGPSEIGYIAEEVDSLGMRCLVLYEDANNTIPLSINYKKMVMFTNEIVKQHHTEIEALKAEVAALTAEKNALRNENKTLRTENTTLQGQQEAFGKQLDAISRRIQLLETTAGNR